MQPALDRRGADILRGRPPEHRPALSLRRSGEHLGEALVERKADGGKRGERPHPRVPRQRDPACDEERDGRRSNQAATQVVEDLPARDRRQTVALEAFARVNDRQQPLQDLPVAAHPAMLPARVDEHARRIVVDDFHVGDERGPRVESFEEIVRQQRVVRHAPIEHRAEGVDFVQALAGEDALVKEVLIDVRDRGRIRIDAGVARVRAREGRAERARHRHADARLQDAVALHDAADHGIDARAVEGMRDDADELLGRVAGQERVPSRASCSTARTAARRGRRPARRSPCPSRRAGAR